MPSTTYARQSANALNRTTRGDGSSSPPAGPSNPGDGDIKMNARGSPSENEDEEDIEGWTEDTFVDKPVNGSQPTITMFRTLKSKLEEVTNRLEEAIEEIKDAAFAIEEASPNDESLKNVEGSLFKAFDQRQVLQIKIRCLEQLEARLKGGEEFTNVNDAFNHMSEPEIKEYLAKSQRAKLRKFKEYIEFRSNLWSINHDDACPPVSNFLEKGINDEESDDEIDVGGQTQTYRCPITLTLYQDPMTCTKCSHTYSKIAIYDLIDSARKQRRSAKCPVTGCSVTIEKTDLKPNPSMQKRANEFARRQQDKDDEREDDIASIEDSDED
ncbi:hypothetical protein J007_02851 [Cryptococcus neoformans]|nr:hypothetical protein C356_02882 [Cryptococcus neoformans var. grubii c45]OXB37395.1 hypothetical protein J007_02851 [Cryptococcus neoformans var. grubii]OXC61649.1 hypothetical protein C358_02930 [Cryptococcus neoformans var. grubii MW-RSA852]